MKLIGLKTARHTAGSLLNWFGGGLTRMAGTAFATGAFFVLFGVMPIEFAKAFVANPPAWLMSGWTRLFVLLLGLAILGVAFNFNRWSRRQMAIDALAEELSWAIHNLLNSQPPASAITEEALNAWDEKFKGWCNKVSDMLEDRAFFSRADQLHFDRLGFVDQMRMSGVQRLDWLLSQLRVKFERLRDVIQWAQTQR